MPQTTQCAMDNKLINATAITVRYFRQRVSISQEELASRANLDRTYISGVERGSRNITLKSLDHIVEALNLNYSEFFLFIRKEFKIQKMEVGLAKS